VPGHPEPLILSRADPEVTRSGVALMEKVDWTWPRTEAGVRDLFIERTYFDLLGERLQVVAREADAPFLSGGVGFEDLNRERGLYSMGASARVGHELDALEALIWETRRAAQHGFHPSELERSRADQLRMAESWLTERDHAPSRDAIGELVRHFLDDEWMAGTEAEVAYYRQILPTVTLDELQAFARRFHTGESRVVVVTVPGGAGAAPPPSDAQVREALDRADATEHIPWEPVVAEGPLVTEPPAPGAVTETAEIADIGVTQWTLSNGATVLVKPTDLANDEILLAAWSPGGRSLVADADYHSAAAAASIALRSGVGPFTDRQLGQVLAGHDAGVGVSIGQTWEQAWGSTRPADLELTLKLLHQRMVRPRFDPDMVALDRQNRVERLERRTQDPAARFADLRDEVLWGNHLRYRAWTTEDVAQIDAEVVERVYRERFDNAADFTFAIVGDVDIDAQQLA
jgi:zinc protease